LQGRIGAIDDAKYGDLKALFADKMFMSTMLKTGVQYGFQPVTMSEITLLLLALYIDYIRPNFLTEPNDPLFIGQSGAKLRMGRLLTAYFKRKLSLNISSTIIRSLVETEAEGLLSSGAISSAERASVLSINGHTGATSVKFYQKRSLVEDVAAGISVHQKLLRTEHIEMSPEASHQTMLQKRSLVENAAIGVSARQMLFCADDVKTSPEPSCRIMFDAADENSIPDNYSLGFSSGGIPSVNISSSGGVSSVGIIHPSFNETHARRVKWTNTEVNIVGTWIVNYLKLYPDCNCVISKCLSYILSDTTVNPNFHPNHVMDSTRLRYGWEKYKEENNLNAQY
jgi:hypothetical protein